MDPAFVQDPHPTYRVLRERSPVHYEEALGGWIFTRHADVRAVLNHPEIVRPPAGDILLGRVPEDVRRGLAVFERKLTTSLPFANPPHHTRLRGFVVKAFSPSIGEALRPRIQERVDGLLDQLWEAGRGDLLEDYAYRIPTWVIMELVGLPHEDFVLVKELVTRITPIIGQSLHTGDPVAAAIGAAAATQEFSDYLDERIAERRTRPREDLLSKLIETPLTNDELCLTVLILLIAGTETTTHHIGNAVHTLLRHPDKAKELRTDPSIIETAAEELLRFEGPVPITTPQLVTNDLEIGGQQLPSGSLVYPVVGAANRDPARFSDPEEIDLRRPVGGVLAFGGGIHFCIGQHLARLEGVIAIGSVIARFPDLRFDDTAPEPIWRPDPTLRGLVSLPVVVRD